MNPFSFSDGLNKRVNWAQISEIKYCFNKEFFWLVPTKMSFILFRKTSSILFQENYAKFQSDNDIFIFCNDVVPFRFNINISYLGLRYFADILFQENIFYLVKTIFFLHLFKTKKKFSILFQRKRFLFCYNTNIFYFFV